MGMPGDTGLSGCHVVPSGDGEALMLRDGQDGGMQWWRLCITVCPRLLLEVLV